MPLDFKKINTLILCGFVICFLQSCDIDLKKEKELEQRVSNLEQIELSKKNAENNALSYQKKQDSIKKAKTFSFMTPREMIKIINMDVAYFEKYIESKGYVPSISSGREWPEIGYSFQHNFENETRFLTLAIWDPAANQGTHQKVDYQTNNKKEFENFKNLLLKSNFEFDDFNSYEDENGEKQLYYNNDKFSVVIDIITDPSEKFYCFHLK